jgi:hypothetical protein
MADASNTPILWAVTTWLRQKCDAAAYPSDNELPDMPSAKLLRLTPSEFVSDFLFMESAVATKFWTFLWDYCPPCHEYEWRGM